MQFLREHGEAAVRVAEILSKISTMRPFSRFLERKLQISGTILTFGLVVEALCLLGRGPIAFLVFAGVGGFSFLLGNAYYFAGASPIGKWRSLASDSLYSYG
jgi:hypothetical protein